MRPDYEMSVAEVFISVSRHVIYQRVDLEILCHRQENSPIQLADLPSWCPDYSIRPLDSPIRQFMDRHPYTASGTNKNEYP